MIPNIRTIGLLVSLAGILSIATSIWFWGESRHKDGVKECEAVNLAAEKKITQTKKDIKNEVIPLSDNDLRERLDRWMRD